MPSKLQLSRTKTKSKPAAEGGGKHSPGNEDKTDSFAPLPRPHVIYDESIEQLRITEERLQQHLDQCKEESANRFLKESSGSKLANVVAVRKEIPLWERPKPMGKVAVLKRAPAEAPLAGEVSARPLVGSFCETGFGKAENTTDWYAAGICPRFNKAGHLIDHSLLGDPVMFYRTALTCGTIEWNLIPREIRSQLEEIFGKAKMNSFPSSLPCIPEQPTPTSYQSNDTDNYSVNQKDGFNAPERKTPLPSEYLLTAGSYDTSIFPSGDAAALENWEHHLIERKQVQNRLTSLVRRGPEHLAMNCGEDYYTTRLEAEKIDRTMPLMENGKGWRYKSEFWNQCEYVGPTYLTDISTTLTLRQRGIYDPLEFVQCPTHVRMEKGLPPLEKQKTEEEQSSYLLKKAKKFGPILKELVKHEPEMDTLEVVGQKIAHNEDQLAENEIPHESKRKNPTITVTQEFCEIGTDCPYPVEKGIGFDSLFPEINYEHGPCLLIQGQMAQYQPTLTTSAGEAVDKNSEPLIIQVIFQSDDPHPQTEYIELFNNGTAVLYFEWSRIREKSAFGLKRSQYRQFYFDPSPGTIKPGEVAHIPVSYKSTCEGIFSESWRLDVKPVLRDGAPVILQLRGVSVWPDEYQYKASSSIKPAVEVEKIANYTMVYRLLHNLISYLQPPQRPVTPVNPAATEEGAFSIANPGLFYHTDVITKLHALYQDLKQRLEKQFAESDMEAENLPEFWDLSVKTLRRLIYTLEPDKTKATGSAKLEEEIGKFFQLVNVLSFPPPSVFENRSNQLYQIGYEHLVNALSDLFQDCSDLRAFHGLPPLSTVVQKGKPNGKVTQGAGKQTESKNKIQIDESLEKEPSGENPLGLSDALWDVSYEQIALEPNPQAWRMKAMSLAYSRISSVIEEITASWEEV